VAKKLYRTVDLTSHREIKSNCASGPRLLDKKTDCIKGDLFGQKNCTDLWTRLVIMNEGRTVHVDPATLEEKSQKWTCGSSEDGLISRMEPCCLAIETKRAEKGKHVSRAVIYNNCVSPQTWEGGEASWSSFPSRPSLAGPVATCV
jgi:hypothetical protein